jgi:predicted RNA-binding protein with PUA-like domain
MVDVRFTSAFTVPVTLQSLRATPLLSQMLLLRRGNRLSVMPITRQEFDTIVQLGRKI